MSHFIGLVITDSLECTLAPYCEQDEEFYTPHEDTESYKEDYDRHIKYCQENEKPNEYATFAEYLENENSFKKCKTQEDIDFACGAGRDYFTVDENDEVTGVYYMYNDNAKWDWYVDDGGRWASNNGIILKNGKEYTDYNKTLRLGDIDFDAMLQKDIDRKREAYRTIIGVIGHIPSFTTWEEIKKAHPDWKVDDIRNAYWEQPDLKTYSDWQNEKDEEGQSLYWERDYGSLERFMCTEEEFIGNASLPYHCIVTDDDWYEKGHMGWWACVSDEKKGSDWYTVQKKVLEGIDPETDVHLVDFHI